MINRIKHYFFGKRQDRKKKNMPKFSYSQSGEDLILQHIFRVKKIINPTYIDIGAHHPFFMNNTALLYKAGSRGINIEPDPDLFKLFPKHRKNDINLNIGIAPIGGELDFYRMNSSTLNTFSKEEAENMQANEGYPIKEVLKIKTLTIEKVIDQYSNGKFPDVLSIDVEGWDLEILQMIDFEKSKPKIICVETITFSKTGNGVKRKNVIDFLLSKGYKSYADTNINTIFILAGL